MASESPVSGFSSDQLVTRQSAGSWQATDQELPAIYKELGTAISDFFKPSQDWRLAEVESRERDLEPEHDLDKLAVIRARAVIFNWQAKKPPLSYGLWVVGRGKPRINLSRVFLPEVKFANLGNQEGLILVEELGSIWAREGALEDITSPYYLEDKNYSNWVSLDVSLNNKIEKVDPKTEQVFAANLAISLVLGDLDDYARLEATYFRQVRRQIAQGKFNS